jgi:hypothetical protein
LVPTFDIDDAETSVSKADSRMAPNTGVVWTSVREQVPHLHESARIYGPACVLKCDSANSAHGLFLLTGSLSRTNCALGKAPSPVHHRAQLQTKAKRASETITREAGARIQQAKCAMYVPIEPCREAQRDTCARDPVEQTSQHRIASEQRTALEEGTHGIKALIVLPDMHIADRSVDRRAS